MSLRLDNINKSFDSKVILRDFSCLFEDTGLYIIAGESGIGKTTLLRIISGLDTDFTGTVTGGGLSSTSYMFQEHRLFPTINALENVLVGIAKPTDLDVEKAKLLMLDVMLEKADFGKKPEQLSGGMRQRVSLIRAVMKESPILLLDEPTKELDADAVSSVIQLIKSESKKRTVIVVTHDDPTLFGDNYTLIHL